MTSVPQVSKCVELLPPTRSQPHRAVEWDRETHEMTLCGRRTAERYAVSEFYVGRGFDAGRAFDVVKLDGGEVRNVFLADDRRRSTCDCEGFSFAGTERADHRHGTHSESLGCKHLDGLAAVVANGWLPDPRANPDQDAGPTEPDDQPDPEDMLPACFDGVSGTGAGVPF